MENIEKFFGFLNSELDETTERTLFYELASNDELRTEFRCFSAISDNIKANVNIFTPSHSQKASLFAKAGISLSPSEETAILASASSSATLKNVIYSKSLLSIVTMSAIVILFSLFYKNLEESIGNVKKEKIQITHEQIPFISSIDKTEPNNSQVVISSQKKMKNIIIDQNDEKNENLIDDKSENQRYSELSHSDEKEFLNKQNILFSKRGEISKLNKDIDLINIFDNYSRVNYGLSFEFKNATSWHLPKEKINPSQFSKVNNLGFDMYYKVNDNIKIGAGVKQETFYAEYTGQESDGLFYSYKQQPNLTTISANIRYYPYDLGALKTFAQLNIGGNTAGWVARPVIGFEYMPYESFSLVMGFEYSYFSFKHQNARFGSSKAGLIYGLSYNF